MHPLHFEELAQQRIENLHRAAARYRLLPRPQRQKPRPRRVRGAKLQRAPAA